MLRGRIEQVRHVVGYRDLIAMKFGTSGVTSFRYIRKKKKKKKKQ